MAPQKSKRSTAKAALPVRPAHGTEFLRKKIADQKRLLQAAYEETERTRGKLLDAQEIADRALLAGVTANDKGLVLQRDMARVEAALKAAVIAAEQAELAASEWRNRAMIVDRDLAAANERLRKMDDLAMGFRKLFLENQGQANKPTEATWLCGVPRS